MVKFDTLHLVRQRLDIKTSHNIILAYEQAGLANRIGAFVIDIALVWIVIMLSLLVLPSTLVQYLIVVPLLMMYHLGSEMLFNGQSIGKRIMKIRVVSLDGRDLDITSILIRWSFRLIDIGLTGGLLACFMITTSGTGQRLGDLLARTTVIYIGSKQRYSLEMLNSLDEVEHQVVYPQVVQYNDQDMLVVKDMLKALEERPTPETLRQAKRLSSKLEEELDITDRPTSVKRFFHELVQDYVLLTR